MMRISKVTLYLGGAYLLLGLQTASWAQTTLLIDDFTIGQNEASLNNKLNPNINPGDMAVVFDSDSSGAHIIGGIRTVMVQFDNGNGEVAASVNLPIQQFDFRSSSSAAGKGAIIWNGLDNLTLPSDGKLNANLRVGGGDTLRLQFSVNEPNELPITLSINGVNVNRQVAVKTPDPFTKALLNFEIPFSEFSGVDFSDVDNITLLLDASILPSQDVLLDQFDVIDVLAPELSATLSVDEPACLDTSGDITYTAVLRNDGQDFANNVVFADSIDSDALLVGTPTASVGSVQVNGQSFTVSIPQLAPGAEATVTFKARPNSESAPGVVISNQGTVSSDGGVFQVNTNEIISTVEECTPSLEISKSVSAGCLDPNDPNSSLSYTLTVTNTSAWNAAAVELLDTLPACTQYNDDLAGASLTPENALSAALGDIAPGASVSVDYTVSAAACAEAGQSFEAMTTASASSGNHLSSTQQVTSATRSFCAPNLSISKTVDAAACLDPNDANSLHTYTITVRNEGNGVASGVNIEDDLANGLLLAQNIAGADVVSNGSSLSLALADIPAGSSATITYQARAADVAPGGANFSNTAVLTPTGVSAQTNGRFCAANLTLKAQAESCLALDGTLSKINITVSNDGDGMSSNASLQSLLKDDTASLIADGKVQIDPASAVPGDHTAGVVVTLGAIDPTSINAQLEYLAPGAEANISYKAALKLAAEDDPLSYANQSFMSSSSLAGVGGPANAEQKLAICAPNSHTPVPVPTLSEWALLLLGSLLGLLGISRIRNDQMIG